MLTYDLVFFIMFLYCLWVGAIYMYVCGYELFSLSRVKKHYMTHLSKLARIMASEVCTVNHDSHRSCTTLSIVIYNLNPFIRFIFILNIHNNSCSTIFLLIFVRLKIIVIPFCTTFQGIKQIDGKHFRINALHLV